MSWDGRAWNVVREGFNADGERSEQPCYWQVEVAPDGTVWLGGSTVSSFDGTECMTRAGPAMGRRDPGGAE